jgi:putative ABC transport system ATP-binding protein
MSLVSIRDVSKHYERDRQQIVALDQVSLQIPKGDFVALMGPSGSGKTTLLNLIGGIDHPTSGEIKVADADIARLRGRKLAAWRSRHIGFIFQFYNLIPVLSAQQNVELPLLLFRMSGKERAQRARTALELVGLGDRLRHFPRQLSGGQEQRVAIARAIVSDPEILLADEPTGDLDRASAAEVLDLLQRLNAEYQKTIVMVTHDPHAAERARRMVHLDKGTLTNGRA